MPRRKQQAPKRAAVYMPDEDAILQDPITEEDGENDTQTEEECSEKTSPKLSEDRELDNKSTHTYSNQNSPISVLSNQDADLESRLSDSSDRLSDFKTSSPPESQRDEESRGSKHKDETGSSLEKMRAAYANFLSDSYWTGIGMDLKNANKANCDSTNGSSKSEFDWHQDALSKTLQQTLSPKPASKPNLFSSVHLYRQTTKPCGSVFTGASRFRCKDCSAAYDTLVELTVHMNKTGHYQDNNHKQSNSSASSSKSRKRNLHDVEGKEDAQKVLKCMFCGHSFDSLQDLSVHMIKTKHYQKVPLKEPIPVITPKLLPPAKKRAFEATRPCSPDSTTGVSGYTEAQRTAILSNANNNRYGYQNGASYTWQFETCKSQILKCMECGSSHDTLQQLTTHMMVTGHFIKVTNSASKKGKQLTLDPLAVEKIQSIAEPAASDSEGEKVSTKNLSPASGEKDGQGEGTSDKTEENETKDDKQESEDQNVSNGSFKYPYLREEDLEQEASGGGDILKSLANTVASAINKAQTGTPSWSAYPSIHAAYQLPNIMKLSLGTSGKSSPLKYMFPGGEIFSAANKSQPLVSSPSRQTSPLPKNNFHAMEELVKKVTEKVAKVEEKLREPSAIVRDSPLRHATPSPCNSEAEAEALARPESQTPKEQGAGDCKPPENTDVAEKTLATENGTDHSDSNGNISKTEMVENGVEPAAVTSPLSASVCGSTAIITDHPPPEQPFVNPLSALQSVMNVHLGKAAKPAMPSLDPMSMLFKMSNSLAEKAAVASSTPPAHTKKTNNNDHLERYFYQQHLNNDQPMDLTKGKITDKGTNGGTLGSTVLSSTISTPSISPSSAITMAKASAAVASFMSTSPLRENALSDISDMLRNLTESQALSKSSTPTSQSERSDIEGATQEETEEVSPAQKRKGRQSNWNPQHLLILQAQFASSLRQTNDGKYIMSDLSPQERMHISRFTGLSMTTISHWLANVKYQLRRTGGTKFLKNLDSGHPVFFCSDCASQIRSPSTYVSHLESHLGFRLRDLAKLSGEQLLSQISQQHHHRHAKGLSEKLFSNLHPSSHPLPPSLQASLPPSLPISLSSSLTSLPPTETPSPDDDDSGAVHQCKLCNRTFASKHAVKLHLSKTHGKSPEDHLMFVCELDKQ
uniref:Teashirt zinc finger homeobox 3 n=1 Tax=Nothobranchius korthausae TaxID=1143690 RepID=A0A1A8GXG9_9TELE